MHKKCIRTVKYRRCTFLSKKSMKFIVIRRGLARGGGDGGRPPRAAKFELYLKIWEGEKYFEAGEKVFMGGEITQRIEETVDNRKNFKL